MIIESFSPSNIKIGPRHRGADPAKVKELAESMRRFGLLQPITVYSPDDQGVELVAGLHRLEAAKLLDWDQIDAICIEDVDEFDREMIEIAENLHRVDLSKEERDRHIRRYAELIEAKAIAKTAEPQPTQNALPVEPRGHAQPKGTVRQIAEATGLSHDTVNRALKPKPERESTKIGYDPYDVERVGERLARRFTVGELQALIDYLAEVIKDRLARAA